MTDRVILAYSGGLDTSVAISWIGKETGREVVAVAAVRAHRSQNPLHAAISQ